jgi:CheY-like chemotaxis protein
MSAEVKARAFEPFFTTKEVGKGTGLGLSQLYGFAKQSGGTARIDSAPGEGTTVTIYLPRTQREVREAAPPVLEPRMRAQMPVLLVDDDDAVRNVGAAMLEEMGFEVTSAASGAEALEVLKSNAFALLLTDVAMPGMSGVELAHAVRERYPDLPILFASGYADLQVFGEQLSDETVLKKPYRLADLAARVESSLCVERRDNVVELKR